MNKYQKAILIGMVLGDAYLQKTGARNARIRLEHSEKQQAYLVWKASQFPELFQGKPSLLTRYHPIWKKTYRYVRWQSYASPEIGTFHRLFYQQGRKIIPKEFPSLCTNPLSLAVWYMDDGYLYHKDKMAYIYVPNYPHEEIEIIQTTLRDKFGLVPVIKTKKKGNIVLIFSVKETQKLFSLIRPFVIPLFSYKLLNPVSTEA